MPSDVTRDEFEHWTKRVDVVEGEIEGEKKVTRHILAETRHNTGLLANVLVRLGGLETRAGGVEKRLESVEIEMKSMRTEMKGMRNDITSTRTDLVNLDRKVDRLEAKVDGFAKGLPKIVGDAVREANRDRGKR